MQTKGESSTKKLTDQKRTHSRRAGFPLRGISSSKEEGPKEENLATKNILDTLRSCAGWEERPHGKGIQGTPEEELSKARRGRGGHRGIGTWGPYQ